MPVVALKCWLAFFIVAALGGASCVRNQQPKKDPALLNDPPGKSAVRQDPPPVQPPAPPGGAVQPPRSDLMAGAVPPLPGMPGTVSRPQPETTLPDDLLLASATTDDERKGILQRLRERREQRNQPPVLPPALDPKPDPKKDPPPMPMPAPMVPDAPAKPAPVPAPAKPANPLADARKVVNDGIKSYAGTADFTCKLTKRDVVGGKQQPLEEVEYAFRKEPLSVHMKVVGENGLGREVLYVKGQNGGKMVILTGKGDLISGKKMEIDPDSSLASGRARTKIYEAGFARPLGVLTKFLDQADAGKRPADTIKFLGPVTRKDVPGSLVGIEMTFLPGDDPLLPKGGSRSYFFDADPKSQSAGLPVLITATENGKEVEYYAFTSFRRPANLTDADFSPDKIGKKK